MSDAIYHVYARGAGQGSVYRDNRDRGAYLDRLAAVVHDQRWYCLSYCLLTTHFHLLIETPEANLSTGMQRLQGGYAQYFNRRHDRTGHVFGSRYGAVRIRSDSQLLATTRYIALNPLEAGLCDRAGEWRWSSHAETVRAYPPGWLAADRLLSYFDGDLQRAKSLYSRFVDEPRGQAP